ncbi:Dabb family protein [Flavobacteriaceae bacterium]|nr:Dabb family protein [Flavobacteriaceae bacterium]
MSKRILIVILSILSYSCSTTTKPETPVQTLKLQHVVLIQYKDSVTSEEFKAIAEGAQTLKEIAGVHNLQYTTNVSPEGLNKGYTHSLTLYFENETDRDEVYLPHPIHQAFVKLFVPFTSDVLVYDYWEE